MTFGESVSTCLRKYVDFNGRASRSEYWWFFLFCVLAYLGALILDTSTNGSVLFVFALLGFFLPITAAAVRRLHDTGKSGAWWFITLVPYVGGIILLVLLAQPGQPFDNRYGPSAGVLQMPSAPTPAPPLPEAPPPMSPRLDDRGTPQALD
jgi:uncharacterized membrane protein YhaH (DUF805 family)